MELRCAKISNQTNNMMDPKNAAAEIKGQRGICCLASGANMPASAPESLPDKVTDIIVTSYMKRPSLGTEASDAIFKRANDMVLVAQTPQYPQTVSASAVFILKNKFVYTCAGDNVIFHFVNGVFKEAFSGAGSAELGNLRFASPKVSGQLSFDKGDHAFLICSAKFAAAFTENQLEDALIRATHTSQKGKKTVSDVKCDRWLKALWDNLPAGSGADDYSAIAISLPAKKKSAKTLIIAIILAVILLVGGFFLLGAIKGGPKPPSPPQAPQQNQDLDYNNMERPVGPNGETPPEPPTRAPQN